MNVKQLLEVLTKKLGFEELSFDENESLTLSFDEIIVTMQVQDTELYLFTRLADLPKEKLLEIYTFLLEANNFMLGTLGGALGIDNATNMISFVNRITLKYADGDLLLSVLEKHVQAVEAISQEIYAILANNLASVETPADSFKVDGMLRI